MDDTTELLRRHVRQLEHELESIRDDIRYSAPDQARYTVNRIYEKIGTALADAYARHELIGL